MNDERDSRAVRVLSATRYAIFPLVLLYVFTNYRFVAVPLKPTLPAIENCLLQPDCKPNARWKLPK